MSGKAEPLQVDMHDTNAHSERKTFCATLNYEKWCSKMFFTAKNNNKGSLLWI